MINLILNFFLTTFILILTAYLMPGFEIMSLLGTLIAVLMVGFMNFLIRPILMLLKVPLNIFTVGGLSFVMNVLLLNTATGFIDGFDIRSWQAAIVAASLVTVIQMVVEAFIGDKRVFLR